MKLRHPLGLFAISAAALLTVSSPQSSAESRRDPNARKGESASVRIEGETRTLVRNDPNGRPWLDSLSTPDIVFKSSTLSRFVDDDNEGPESAPASRHAFALVMENGDVYFVNGGVVTQSAGRITEFKKNYYYVSHDFYIWNPERTPNHVVTTIQSPHRCLIQATDQDRRYNFAGNECNAPGTSYLIGNAFYYKIPDLSSFSSFNPGYGLFYRRALTWDGAFTVGTGPAAFDVRWGFQWLARSGCVGGTFGPCSQWATAYDGINERGVAAAVNFVAFPHFAPDGADLRVDIIPPVEGLLGAGRNSSVLNSLTSTGATGSLDSTMEIPPGGKVELVTIDFGDRLRLALVMARYEDDPLTTSAFYIDRYKKTGAFTYSKALNALAATWMDPLITRSATLYIAPTLGAAFVVDASDETAPYNTSRLSTLPGSLDLNGGSVSYSYLVPPKPRYLLEALRLKEGVTE